jgi:predicted metal-dependent hydrolase
MSAGFDEALEKGIALFDAQKFFEAYEVFEEQWNIEEDEGADLLQGLLQLSVGCSKFETGQFRAAIKLFELALNKIGIYAPSAYDMDIDALLVLVREWLDVARKFEEMGPAGLKAVQEYMARLRVLN